MSRRLAELGLGARAAIASPTTRLRTALTVLSVALGVCVLLIAASVPHAVEARQEREREATPIFFAQYGGTRLLAEETTFKGTAITDYVVQTHPGQRLSPAELPPGVKRLPGPGEMIVSPVVARLLAAPGGSELRRRLGARVVGEIDPGGLIEPDEALLFRGSKELRARGAPVVAHYGGTPASGRVLPIVTLLTIVLVVALLLPVTLFVATAARFGAEERERRLAAIRLVGADFFATARIAAGEALLASALGLALGWAGFLLLRSPVAGSGVAGTAVFPADLRPSLALAALVAVAVPAAALAATLISIRGVAREPLGVARGGRRAARRLTWRAAVPLAGFAVLVFLTDPASRLESFESRALTAVGAVLVLLGAATLLPWAMEAIARRAPNLSVSSLLAVRRLRSGEGTAARVTGAIALAIAGAVALTIVFEAARAETTIRLDPVVARTVNVDLKTPSRAAGRATLARFDRIEGVARTSGAVGHEGRARLLFAEVVLAPGSGPAVLDRIEDLAARIDPIGAVVPHTEGSLAIDQLDRALRAGGLVVLAMIAASLLIASLESLRQRRDGMAGLAAVGAGRGTLARSLFWQATIATACGLVLGVGLGVGLGATLSSTVGLSPVYDWAEIGLIAAIGFAVGVGVTGLTLPTLGRVMRAAEPRPGVASG